MKTIIIRGIGIFCGGMLFFFIIGTIWPQPDTPEKIAEVCNAQFGAGTPGAEDCTMRLETELVDRIVNRRMADARRRAGL